MSEEKQTKKYNYGSCGYDLSFSGPATAEQYDIDAKEQGACVADAIAYVVPRSTLPAWQEAFTPKLEAFTGVTRGVDTEATAKAKARAKSPDKVEDVPEKFKAFNLRATAGLSDEQKAQLAVIAQEVADTIAIDVAPSARGGSRGPAKDLLAKADSVLALSDDEIEAKITKWNGLLEKEFPLERDENGRPTRESLAYMAGEVLKAQ